MKAEERVVIVGGGLAGLRSGERLRELGFNGELVILSQERHLPYHRPALSKEVITGELHPRELGFPMSRELDAIWRLGTPAEKLDTGRRMVSLPGGEEIRYDGLIIATGVESRHMGGSPRHDSRVHVLRTVDDAIGIRNAIASSQGMVVVIGGGLIGCEIAASVRGMGRDVAIIARGDTLLGGATGPTIGKTITDAHRAKGVRMAMGVKILHWVRQPNGIALHLSDGQVLFAAVIVLAVGSVPSVSWLRGSGLVLEDGLMCETSCHVIGAQDVVAAGDVARWPNMRFGGVQRRVEHWLNAVEMGRAAAENLLVGRDASRPYTPVPRFWTEQYGMRVQGAGLPALGTDHTTLTKPTGDHRTITGFIADGKLVGMVALDSPNALIKMAPELLKQNRVTQPPRQPQEQPQPTPTLREEPVARQEPVARPEPVVRETPIAAELEAELERDPYPQLVPSFPSQSRASSSSGGPRVRPHPRTLARAGGRSGQRPPR